MTTHQMRRIDVLIFAIDPVPDGVEPNLIRIASDTNEIGDRSIHVVNGPGEALRLIHRHEPSLLFFWVGSERLGDSAALIEALRRRRPQLPVLAITPQHDENVERAVRAAGAGHYFALDGDADPLLLRRTLVALGFSREPAPPDPRPPRIRGRPPTPLRSR
jgi:CheY-like chemotaxis protein